MNGVRLWPLALMAWGGAVMAAEPLAHLACAAGVHCSGTVSPEEARLVLGMDSQAEAERAFVDASRDFPDHVWRCAATGNQCGHLTQNEAQILIPLAEGALPGAELLRRRHAGADSPGEAAPVQPLPPAGGTQRRPGADPQATPTSRSPARKPGIEVEVASPGPAELVIPPTHPHGGADAGVQPLDGQWTITTGRPQTSGKCLGSLPAAMARVAVAPKSGQFTFERPFSASQLFRDAQISWQRLGSNHWRGTLAASTGTALEGGWTLRVVSERRIEGETTVRVAVPSVCLIRTIFTVERS